MNSSLTPKTTPPLSSAEEEDSLDFGHYVDVLLANKWLIAIITLVVFAIGIIYAFLERPIYESNMVIQVEDPDTGSKSILSQAGGLVDVKTPASAEIEIIRSRRIVGEAVDASKLYIAASPRYVPYIGGWMARRATGLSDPGFMGFGGYVSGLERITVADFDVPVSLEGRLFTVTARAGGQYSLEYPGLQAITGTVGTPLKANTASGPIELLITELAGKPGAQFNVVRNPKLPTIIGLQSSLNLAERVKASGIINVSLQDGDPYKLVRVLNAVGDQYVKQNVERKSAEAQKTLAFLDVQLPQFKKQMEASEEIYNRYRNQKGTVAFNEEAALILGQAVDRQTKLLEAQQRRTELEARFTANHPSVQTLDTQIATLKTDIANIQMRIKGLPAIRRRRCAWSAT
ncbi:Wzz/FepE/Etk N-terminal domain-containing protein [Variovorax sp. SRS16]|uniref:Wzz/FepE/Etk N-terminal domain-containing protein n=1 Tax=Variovorax sp. SRS16 TaxID=282217 RepID=UPI001E4BE519|nr:Wzz/FepE/Etk N-terminal domain-containing protein [Variovorax sp. SRS16]